MIIKLKGFPTKSLNPTGELVHSIYIYEFKRHFDSKLTELCYIHGFISYHIVSNMDTGK